MHGEAEHLGQMAHRGLAAVVLPVGVGDEADGGVEREIGRHGVEAAGIERQEILQPLQRVERQEAGDGKDDHGDRVAVPVLFARRIDPGQAIEPTLDRPQHGAQKGSVARVHARHKGAERYGARHNKGEHQRNLRPADKRHRGFLGSEFFRTDQCVEEVEAEQHGHGQSDDRFAHGNPLRVAASPRRRAPSMR